MPSIRKHAWLLAGLLLPAVALANDGVYGSSAGGIVFRKTDAVAMKKEVLSISRTLISVDYEFLNESGADVEENIAFPLPSYEVEDRDFDAYYGQPKAFSILVDGKKVDFSTSLEAFLNGRNVTAQLRKAGLTDRQIAFNRRFEDGPDKRGLTPAQVQQLTRLKLIGPGDKEAIGARWTVQVNYLWKQKFPAGRIVKVHHEYRPFAGSGPGGGVAIPEIRKQYCMDDGFVKAFNKLGAKTPGDTWSEDVSYILKTGNTWKNGIEDFTLNVIKQDPAELVSLCFPGKFKKIDARTLQVRLTNFRPKANLGIYFENIKGGDGQSSQGVMPVLPR